MGASHKSIFARFQTEGMLSSIKPFGNGHINNTFLAVTDQGQYILQQLNPAVFPRPEQAIDNIAAVTKHIQKKTIQAGGDPLRRTLTLIPCKDGGYVYHNASVVYRMYAFVENSKSLDATKDPAILYQAGKTIGTFHRLLSDFDGSLLHQTIPHFHDTPQRMEQLEAAAKRDTASRKMQAEELLCYARERRDEMGVLWDAYASGTVPERVVHNDTKLNNILFDSDTGEGLCLADLDTVMPGTLLWDYGDCVRSCVSTAAEDEADAAGIRFDPVRFTALTKGFLKEAGDILTAEELSLMPTAPLVMTYECGVRFLTDYLNGDTYFKTSRSDQNLDRARNQFALCVQMEQALPFMRSVLYKTAERRK